MQRSALCQRPRPGQMGLRGSACAPNHKHTSTLSLKDSVKIVVCRTSQEAASLSSPLPSSTPCSRRPTMSPSPRERWHRLDRSLQPRRSQSLAPETGSRRNWMGADPSAALEAACSSSSAARKNSRSSCKHLQRKTVSIRAGFSESTNRKSSTSSLANGTSAPAKQMATSVKLSDRSPRTEPTTTKAKFPTASSSSSRTAQSDGSRKPTTILMNRFQPPWSSTRARRVTRLAMNPWGSQVKATSSLLRKAMMTSTSSHTCTKEASDWIGAA